MESAEVNQQQITENLESSGVQGGLQPTTTKIGPKMGADFQVEVGRCRDGRYQKNLLTGLVFLDSSNFDFGPIRRIDKVNALIGLGRIELESMAVDHTDIARRHGSVDLTGRQIFKRK